MANIASIIEDQACRMRGRAVQFDGRSDPDDTNVPELLDRALSNLSRARMNWLRKEDKKALIDMTDVCNLLAIAADKTERGDR